MVFQKGKYQEASECFKEAVQVKRESLGSSNSIVALSIDHHTTNIIHRNEETGKKKRTELRLLHNCRS